LTVAKEAAEQFVQAWQQRNGNKLKAVFVESAIRESLKRVRRDERLEERRKRTRVTRGEWQPQIYRDPKTNVVFEVNVGFRIITAAKADNASKPMLHNPEVGFVVVTEHAIQRFGERFLGRFTTRTPKSFDAREMLWESFCRAKPTIPKNADQRLRNNEGRTAIYLFDKLSGLRYVVHETKLMLLTVEIPVER
jgi:hypothetical protein